MRLAGFVTAVRTMMGKRGKIAFVSLEDLSGQIEIMVSGQTLENCADYLKSDQVLIIESKVSRDDYGGGDGLRIMANQVMTLQMARERYARSLSLALAPGHDIERLAAILTAHRLPDTSHIPLQLSYSNDKASGKFQVPPKMDGDAELCVIRRTGKTARQQGSTRELVRNRGRLKQRRKAAV